MAVKVEMEIHYHLITLENMVCPIVKFNRRRKKRMIQAIEKVMNDFPDVFSFGDEAEQIHSYGLIEEEIVLKETGSLL